MNIFNREMKAHRKSLIIWCVGMVLMVFSQLNKYDATSSNGQSLNNLMLAMPKSLQAILGSLSFDLSKLSGYYGLIFIYLALIATIHASMLGADIISKEERDKTSEFLFVKPVSRSKIVTAKLLAAFSNIFILNIVTLISSIAIAEIYSKGEPMTWVIVNLMMGMFVLQLIFMVLGTCLAAVSKNPKSASSLTMGILLTTYVLYSAIGLNSNLEVLKYLTPFKYFDAKNLNSSIGFEPVFVILSGLIIAVLLSATYVFYRRRDLNV
jgi:ABC-2 type transport system permease protein